MALRAYHDIPVSGEADLCARFALNAVKIRLRANCNLLNHFKLIWAIQPPEQKYSA